MLLDKKMTKARSGSALLRDQPDQKKKRSPSTKCSGGPRSAAAAAAAAASLNFSTRSQTPQNTFSSNDMTETIQIPAGQTEYSGKVHPPQRSKISLPPHVSDVKDTKTRDVHVSILVAIFTLTSSVALLVGPLPALGVLTICGVHLVYTHVWCIATILAVCDRTGGCHGYMGVLTAMGVAITVPWYGLLIFRSRDDTVGRAISGWGRWIVQDICGSVWPYNINSVPRLIRWSYHLVDLAVHFLPTPWLLSRYGVTPLDCVFAFLISRTWSISASTFHLTLDWTFLRNWPPRVCARSQTVTPFVTDGVINDIYGLRPTIPSSSLHFLYTVEVATLVIVALLGTPSVSMLPYTSQIEGAMIACASIGAVVGAAGITSIFFEIQKAQRQ